MTSDIQMLQACIDEEDESYFRFLINEDTIKYISITGGVYATDDMCFAPALITLLPPLPPGD